MAERLVKREQEIAKMQLEREHQLTQAQFRREQELHQQMVNAQAQQLMWAQQKEFAQMLINSGIKDVALLQQMAPGPGPTPFLLLLKLVKLIANDSSYSDRTKCSTGHRAPC